MQKIRAAGSFLEFSQELAKLRGLFTNTLAVCELLFALLLCRS
jgi:hypothetical protein